jgi:hypothetical protein
MDKLHDSNGRQALWIGACAHQLQRRWRTIDPVELEAQAAALWQDARLRSLTPVEAAAEWLRPLTTKESPSAGPGQIR